MCLYIFLIFRCFLILLKYQDSLFFYKFSFKFYLSHLIIFNNLLHFSVFHIKSFYNFFVKLASPSIFFMIAFPEALAQIKHFFCVCYYPLFIYIITTTSSKIPILLFTAVIFWRPCSYKCLN